MEFVLTAKAEDDGYGGSVLTVTEMTFTPDYSIGEKLQKAFLNMLMGMGTVFVVLLFISFIISRLKMVNSWVRRRKIKRQKRALRPQFRQSRQLQFQHRRHQHQRQLLRRPWYSLRRAVKKIWQTIWN